MVTWNGNVAIDDTANVAGALTSLTRAAGENVGASNYTAGTIALSGVAAANYSAYVPGTNALNITPAPLIVTANDAQRATGAPNPPFTASYSGFQFGETPAVLGSALAFSTPATVNSPAGLYAITPSSLTSTNYTITYVNGTLAVSGLPPSVTGNPFSAQLAAVQRINGGEIRVQQGACLCPPRTARGPVLDGVVAGSSRQCESTLDENLLDTVPPGQCFFLSSNEY